MKEKKIPYKIYLEEDEMPKQWYNLRADMINKPAPLLNPATGKPVTLGACRYEEEAGTIVKSRNIRTYDLKGIIKCILRRVSKAGIG